MTAGRFDHLLTNLPADSEIYPHQVDLLADRVLLTRIPAERQREASFLDERALAPGTEGAWFPWRLFEESAARAGAAAPAYLFHLGHCGSTLVSRLLEAATGVRALREPLPLRTFAVDKAEESEGTALLAPQARARRLGLFERLWARGGAVVKATSICNGLIDDVAATSPAVFVAIPARDHLAALLGGANAAADLKGFAQMRRRRWRLFDPDPFPLSGLSAGELAAMGFLVEAASAARARRPLLDVDFDAFLADPASGLGRIAAHFGLGLDDARVKAALAGPIMTRYAKAEEHPFDAGARRSVLDQAHRLHADEIARGLAWLEKRAATLKAAAAALARYRL